jgi:hypothetical protein
MAKVKKVGRVTLRTLTTKAVLRKYGHSFVFVADCRRASPPEYLHPRAIDKADTQ